MQPLQYKVYLLDDDTDDLELLTAAFVAVDCVSTVKTFTTAVGLLQQLESDLHVDLPDLIVLDHQMPLFDGSAVAKAIKEEKGFRTVTVIAYSTTLQKMKVETMLSNGVDYFTTKAISFDAMKEDVRLFCDVIVKKQHSLSKQ